MTTPNAITPYNTIRRYMRSDYMHNSFMEIMESQSAKAYIGSVLITVSASQDLQECTPKSIAIQAMRAATLGLSCDPNMKQAHLVPYNNYKAGTKEATLIIHWKGLVKMASSTGKYKYINVSDIYDGEEVTEDRISGLHTVTGKPNNPRVIIGRLAAFETLLGFKKTIYMTTEEIHAHAKIHAPGYNNDKSAWKDPKKKDDMERKTPMRALMSWAELSPLALAIVNQEEVSPEIIDGGDLLDPEDITFAPEIKNSKASLTAQLTGEKNPDPVKDSTWAEWESWKRRANIVRVEVSNVSRNATTDGDLVAYIKEITVYITGGEQQADA